MSFRRPSIRTGKRPKHKELPSSYNQTQPYSDEQQIDQECRMDIPGSDFQHNKHSLTQVQSLAATPSSPTKQTAPNMSEKNLPNLPPRNLTELPREQGPFEGTVDNSISVFDSLGHSNQNTYCSPASSDVEAHESLGSDGNAGARRNTLLRERPPTSMPHGGPSGIEQKSSSKPSTRMTIGKFLKENFVEPPYPQHNGYYPNSYYQESSTEKYKRERNEFKRKCEALEKENAQHQEAIRVLKMQSKKNHEDVQRTKLSANQMQTELDNKDFFLGRQATDQEVGDQFDALLGSIKTWSTNFTGGQGIVGALDSSLMAEYLHVAPFYMTSQDQLEKVFSTNKKKRRLFVRGLAAYKMSTTLFRTLESNSQIQAAPLDVWLDESAAKSYASVEYMLHSAGDTAVPQRKFHDWRALTAELLSKCNGQGMSNEQARICARGMAKEVMHVVHIWAKHRDELSKLEDTLFMIYGDAIKFSQRLRQQRACWSIRFPLRQSRPGQPDQLLGLGFIPPMMRDEWEKDEGRDPQELRKRYVEIVITPALNKRGTVEGERFDVEHTVRKASVIMFTA